MEDHLGDLLGQARASHEGDLGGRVGPGGIGGKQDAGGIMGAKNIPTCFPLGGRASPSNGRKRGIQIYVGTAQLFHHLHLAIKASRMGDHKLQSRMALHHPKDHIGGTMEVVGGHGIKACVGDHQHTAGLATGQDGLEVGGVDLGVDVVGVDLDACNACGGEAVQLCVHGRAVGVRMKGAKGDEAGISGAGYGEIIDFRHLAGIGGDVADD